MPATSSERAHGVIVAAALLATSISSTTFAAPTATEVSAARDLYREGNEALNAHDLPRALKKLTAAWEIIRTPLIGVALARAQIASGLLVEARESCLAVGRLPAMVEETDRSRAARVEAGELARSLETRLARVTIALAPTITGPPPTIALDGVALPVTSIGVVLPVNAGAHTVTTTWGDGARVDDAFSIVEGERTTRTIQQHVGVSIATTEVAPIAGAPSSMRDAGATTERSRVLWYSGLALAGTGLVVGGVTGVIAWKRSSDLSGVCPNDQCQPPHDAELSSARAYGTVATYAFIGAGVGVALIGIDLLTASDHDAQKPTAHAWVGPSGIVVSGIF